MPLHIPSLQHLGIESYEDLLEAEKNIEAGVHILMGYARRVDSVLKALSFYNAGPSRWKAGRGYARAVLSLYREMEGRAWGLSAYTKAKEIEEKKDRNR